MLFVVYAPRKPHETTFQFSPCHVCSKIPLKLTLGNDT